MVIWVVEFSSEGYKKKIDFYVESISSIHFSFFVFQYLVKVTKNKKISCPVYLLFTEKVNFLLANKEKNSQLKLEVNKQDS